MPVEGIGPNDASTTGNASGGAIGAAFGEATAAVAPAAITWEEFKDGVGDLVIKADGVLEQIDKFLNGDRAPNPKKEWDECKDEIRERDPVDGSIECVDAAWETGRAIRRGGY